MVSIKKQVGSKRKNEKTFGILRYIAATAFVFCVVTFSQRSIAIDALDTTGDTFAGGSLRCAIATGEDMYSKQLMTGFNYELLKEFAATDNCALSIVTAHEGENYIDSLMTGAVDIVVLPYKDTSISGITVSKQIEGNVWAVKSGKFSHIREINLWISHFTSSGTYSALKDRFFRSYDPYIKAGRGITTKRLSPYDDLIKKYASEMGWDWRMLAAVIYQESRFSINSHSSRGAAGLMQVMPSTAKHYDVTDLLDPQQNIMAGTSHLERLQKMFRSPEISPEQQIKFVLAAYNAGEGRIGDCRKFAADHDYDSSNWDEIVKVIPEMRNRDMVKASDLKFGRFNGTETIRYVDNVLDHYRAFCEICPA
ncbi:MAG: transglycosylase SLT domain-containing protein [Bacteroidetes bacterium]|uniref:Transglycosylase SLT domain-containing protein n=1 Tax=Candidatus Cryptobacteroides excrementavium TaxID=2840759 RepID=A0A9D9NR37_9BACT|nr:transglycosylase SLT domain-containing protein [Candidatus Cryptobacteroides excrementavium]